MNKIFENKFRKSLTKRYNILKEDDSLAKELETAMDSDPSDVSAEDANLEKEMTDMATEPKDPAAPSSNEKSEDQILKDRITQRIEDANAQIVDWSNKIETVMRFLNDPTMSNSMKSYLDAATENSPLDKVKKSCGTRITRIASEMAALTQELRAQVGGTSVEDIKTTTGLDLNAPMYDVVGRQVDASYRGIIIQNGNKYLLK